jgi:hypothetical protein
MPTPATSEARTILAQHLVGDAAALVAVLQECLLLVKKRDRYATVYVRSLAGFGTAQVVELCEDVGSDGSLTYYIIMRNLLVGRAV